MAEHLGPHTARTALKTFAARALGKPPESLALEDVPRLLDALRPMLRTLVGATRCEDIVGQLAWELRK